MKLRLTGIREIYQPTDEEELRGRRLRYGIGINPGERKLYATLEWPEIDLECMDVPVNELPEGAKIGDEFELSFQLIKGR